MEVKDPERQTHWVGDTRGKIHRVRKRVKIPKEISHALPFLILVCYSMLGSVSIWLLQKYGSYTPNSPFFGVICADSSNLTGGPSFRKSFYFISTIFSSIGYGDMVPCSWQGKLITVVLALTGVPLTLLCLGKLGRLLRRLADRFWHGFVKKGSTDGKGGFEEPRLPLAVGIGMALIWVLLSSVYFLFAIYYQKHETDDVFSVAPESWTYFDAVYFTVISLFTIGFGDYSPKRNEVDVATFGFIFVGLSLVSMCVAIAQKRMESQFEKIVSLIRSVYREGEIKLDSEGNPQFERLRFGGEESKAAQVVLEMWKRDPGGKWLHPLINVDEEDVKKVLKIKPSVMSWKKSALSRHKTTQVSGEELDRLQSKISISCPPSGRIRRASETPISKNILE